MANPEHLKILKQGVKTWNKWRYKRADIKADLSRAYLPEADLRGADLSWANLRSANLIRANLRNAILNLANIQGANLRRADLRGANLGSANLREVNLSVADLTEANLKEADLRKANLNAATLNSADIRAANLMESDLSYALLYQVKLTGAFLVRTNFIGADLHEAILQEVNLRLSDLMRTRLENANLKNADLRHCALSNSNLTGAILTGARLYGAARDDWIIKDLECKYVYWDKEGAKRSPKDRDLEPREFEQIYASLPTIEYIFENGMTPIDPLIMDRVVQIIRERQPDFDIKIDSINARGLSPSVKFTVQHEKQKEPALEEVKKEYDAKIKQLESERDRYYQLVARALDTPKEVKLINATPGSIVAIDGSTISIQEHINHARQLLNVVANEAEQSKTFANIAKKKALDIIGGAIEDIAKGQLKEAAKQIVELGKDLGPVILKTAAYVFFSGL